MQNRASAASPVKTFAKDAPPARSEPVDRDATSDSTAVAASCWYMRMSRPVAWWTNVNAGTAASTP